MIRRAFRKGGWALGLLLLLTQAGYAQSSTQQEITVFLKNGKVVKGMTTLSMFEGHLTLEKDTFTQTHIPYADIQQIVFGPVPEPNKVRIKKESLFTVKEEGYFGMIDIGFLLHGEGSYDGPGMSVTMVNGYALSPHLRLGLGVGVEGYGYSSVTTVPLFLSLSGLMNRRRWTPLYFVNVGSSVAWANSVNNFSTFNETKGGLMVHPGVGYRYNTGQMGVSLSLGYKVQKALLRYGWEDWNTGAGGTIEVEERQTLRRLSLTVGIHF